MNNQTSFDVIVVGAGPAGSSCATLLSRAGLGVLLLDKAKFPRHKICGDCVNPGCWQFFDLLGISPKLRQSALVRIDHVRIMSQSGSEVNRKLHSSTTAPFFALKRAVLDQMLLENAIEAGAQDLQQARVTEIHRNSLWRVEVSGKGGKRSPICTSKFIVGADGRNSIVARKMGTNQTANQHKEKKRNRVGLQWHFGAHGAANSAIELFLFDSGYCGVVGVSETEGNLAMATTPDMAGLAEREFARFLQETIFKNYHAAREFSDLTPLDGIFTTYPINPRSQYASHKTAFLIGDARQTLEPFTGQGIYFALQDGIGAAAKILRQFDLNHRSAWPRSKSRFWVNRIYSPVLRRSRLAEYLIDIGARNPYLVPLAVRPVLGRIVG